MFTDKIIPVYKALVNLYGAILADDAYKILKNYFPELKLEDLFEDLEERKKYYTRGYLIRGVDKTDKTNYLLQLTEIKDDNYIATILSRKHHIGYFVYKDFNDFIKYKDSSYVEPTKEFVEFYKSLLIYCNRDTKIAGNQFKKILQSIRTGKKELKVVITDYAEFSKDKEEKVQKSFVDFVNSLRKPYYLGHTEKEYNALIKEKEENKYKNIPLFI